MPRTYQPMEQERLVFAAMLMGLSSTEQATARLSIYLFGYSATRSGLEVSNH